ncbi:VOC domain-containing protein [Shewanella violacea]
METLPLAIFRSSNILDNYNLHLCKRYRAELHLCRISRKDELKQSIVHIALVVNDYDEAIDFYVNKLKFELVEDTYQSEQDKRWVVVSPPGSNGVTLLLARASKPEQSDFVGNQAGGRVFLFLNTDDFWRDYNRMLSEGIKFIREPKEQDYGTVAVFEDLYGNLWDLLQLNPNHPMASRAL